MHRIQHMDWACVSADRYTGSAFHRVKHSPQCSIISKNWQCFCRWYNYSRAVISSWAALIHTRHCCDSSVCSFPHRIILRVRSVLLSFFAMGSTQAAIIGNIRPIMMHQESALALCELEKMVIPWLFFMAYKARTTLSVPVAARHHLWPLLV